MALNQPPFQGMGPSVPGEPVAAVSSLSTDRFWDGSVIETINIDVTESGGVVSLVLEQAGGGDLTFIFSGEEFVLDATPAATVTLTAGTDTSPQRNYIYVIETEGNLTLINSTTSWPSGPHARVADVIVPSAALVASDGAYKVHAWTDHLFSSTENGHLFHLNKKFRALNATWLDGVSPSDLSSDQISVATGTVFQLHEHAFPALDMASADPVYVVNDNATPYKSITDFGGGGISALSDGTALINGRYLNVVLIGIVNEDDTDCKLFLTLPDAQYTNEGNAQADTNASASYSVGAEYTGVAFLIARYTLQYSSGGGGTFTQSLKTDLRGLEPSTSPGGGAITDHGNLSGLADDDHTQYSLVTGTRAFTGDVTIQGDLTIGDGTDALITLPGASSAIDLTLQSASSGAGAAGNLDLKMASGTIDGAAVRITDEAGTPYLSADANSGAVNISKPLECTDDVTVTGGSITLATPSTERINFGDGDTYLYELADDLLALYVGGSLNFVASATATSFSQDFSMAASKTLLVGTSGFIDMNGETIIGDADADSWIEWGTDDVETHRLGGTDVLDITATLLDGKGQLRLDGFAGFRESFVAGYRLTSSVSNRVAEPASLAFTGNNTQGWQMRRAGSIIGLTLTCDINAISGADPKAQVYQNGAFIGAVATISSPVVGDGQEVRASFSLGTYTFVAGDNISVYRRITTGTITTDDFLVIMEVEYDD